MLEIKRTALMDQKRRDDIERDHFIELVKKVTAFLDFAKIEASGLNALIAHHADADGCIAAVFVDEFLRKSYPSIHCKVLPIANHEFTFRKLEDSVLADEPKIIVTLDLPIHQEPSVINSIVGAGCKLLIYDHHVQQNSVGVRGSVLEINPLREAMPSHPASYFGYSLFHTQFPVLSDRLWLLGVGLIADYALQNYPITVSLLSPKGDLLNGYRIEDPTSAYKTTLGKIASRINAGYRYQMDSISSICFRAVKQAFEIDDPKTFFSAELPIFKELKRLQDRLNSEIDRECHLLKTLARRTINPPSVFYISQSHHFIAGILASKLAGKDPKLVSVVCFRHRDIMQCELRRGRNVLVDLTDVLTRQSNYFRCISSGGHPAAAGALIQADRVEEFYTSFLRALDETLQVRI
jgi:single-stranded DNA-specific DHH superfamily exonuclease